MEGDINCCGDFVQNFNKSSLRRWQLSKDLKGQVIWLYEERVFQAEEKSIAKALREECN